jgi:Uma2 family endonuclease
MAALPKTLISPQEYLEQERKAEYKSEYFNGEVFAMSGARHGHVLIESSLNRDLGNQLRDKPCEVYTSNMRVRVNPTGAYMYCYPDITVTCEKPRFEDGELDTLLNPLFLVEILSDSTEKRDRRVKAPLYRKVESLREYLLVSQHEPYVERYTRQPSGEWLIKEAEGLDSSIQLASLGVTLKLSEIYRQVEFPQT